MKKGDRVTIYEDPWTKQREEGQAVVVKIIETCPDYLRAIVRFDGEKPTYERTICF